MKIEIDLTEKQLIELEEFIQNMGKPMVFHVLSDKEYNMIYDLFEPVFDKIYTQKLHDKYLNTSPKCDFCGHTVDYHSKVGKMLCTREGCSCFELKIKELDNGGNQGN